MQSLAQVNFDSQDIKTMSSREIAAHTGKDHKHVMRDCVNMFHELILLPKEYAQDWVHPQNGQTYQEYVLDEDLVMTLIAGYSVKLRHAVIKRWKELEAKQSILLPNFTDPAAAANAWAAEFKAKQHAEAQLSIAAPKVEYYEKVVERDHLLNATQVSQKLGMSAMKMNACLDGLAVYSKNVKRSRTFQQWFIDKGYGELKQTEAGYPQAMFTLAGEAWIVQKFVSEGLI